MWSMCKNAMQNNSKNAASSSNVDQYLALVVRYFCSRSASRSMRSKVRLMPTMANG